MDVLTDVLDTVRLRSRVIGRWELTAPWGLEMDCPDHAFFYVVSRGQCRLEVEDRGAPLALATGDFVFLPRPRRHVLRDAPRTRVVPIEDIVDCSAAKPSGAVLRHGGGGAPTSLVCGAVEFEDGGRNPLVEALPPVIHVTAEGAGSVRWLEATLQFVSSEAASTLPGAATVANRLADILFVQAVRATIAACDGAPDETCHGWLRALADPRIGAVLQHLHERPAEAWSVASLADSVSMSRSALAARFQELVGDSPLHYLKAWRMRKAADALVRGDTIAATARSLGYETEGAFGRAFKRHMGRNPGEYRRSLRTPVARQPGTTPAPVGGRRVTASGA